MPGASETPFPPLASVGRQPFRAPTSSRSTEPRAWQGARPAGGFRGRQAPPPGDKPRPRPRAGPSSQQNLGSVVGLGGFRDGSYLRRLSRPYSSLVLCFAAVRSWRLAHSVASYSCWINEKKIRFPWQVRARDQWANERGTAMASRGRPLHEQLPGSQRAWLRSQSVSSSPSIYIQPRVKMPISYHRFLTQLNFKRLTLFENSIDKLIRFLLMQHLC